MVSVPAFENQYATIYDLLHKDKDYRAEVDFILSQCALSGQNPQKILDVACGTGRHLVEFLTAGLKVHGNDLSRAMINAATEKLKTFDTKRWQLSSAPMQNLAPVLGDSGHSFDLVVAMYTAVGYLVENKDLDQFFRSLQTIVTPGGLFFADFWNGHKMAHGFSPSRVRTFEDKNTTVKRSSQVTPVAMKDALQVHFAFEVTNRPTGESRSFEETHIVRYHTIPEIKSLLTAYGFETLVVEPFFEKTSDTSDAWNFCVLARNKNE